MSTRFRVIALLATVCAGIVLYGVAGVASSADKAEAPKFGGMYRRVIPNNPPSLDPAGLSDVYARTVATQIFDGLVQFDALLRPSPAIAEFWEASRDGRTWTFTLRHGVKFHHGREVTADDAKKPGPLTVFLKRIHGANEFMKGTSPRVEGLKAVDRYTLRITLDEPYAPLLAVLGVANAAVVPKEKVEGQEERFARAPIGTGPFKLVRWDQSKEIVLEANDRYFEGRPYLDTVSYRIGVTYEDMFGDFISGKLEDSLIPSSKTEEVHSDPRYRQYQLLRKPTLKVLYIAFNTRMKPFDDVRVRRALNYAVDKERIVREITRMDAIPANAAIPPGMPAHDPDAKRYDYDPDKAKKLLAEAGYPNGAGFPMIKLWASSKAASTKAELTAYQEYFAKVGVKVEIHSETDWPTYVKMLEQGKFGMFRLSYSARIPDPDDFLTVQLHSGGQANWSFYKNSQIDRLLEQARKEFDYPRRIALYRDVERIVADDAPWILQHNEVFERLYQPYVSGVQISFLGDWAVPMKKIWLKKPVEGTASSVQPAR